MIRAFENPKETQTGWAIKGKDDWCTFSFQVGDHEDFYLYEGEHEIPYVFHTKKEAEKELLEIGTFYARRGCIPKLYEVTVEKTITVTIKE